MDLRKRISRQNWKQNTLWKTEEQLCYTCKAPSSMQRRNVEPLVLFHVSAKARQWHSLRLREGTGWERGIGRISHEGWYGCIGNREPGKGSKDIENALWSIPVIAIRAWSKPNLNEVANADMDGVCREDRGTGWSPRRCPSVVSLWQNASIWRLSSCRRSSGSRTVEHPCILIAPFLVLQQKQEQCTCTRRE